MSDLENWFPKLKGSDYTCDSPATPQYNCIAWAAGEDNRPWWPDKMGLGYWPIDEREESVECFANAFQTIGYNESASSEFEEGYEKLAIYIKPDGKVSHMARQKHSGNWTSKCGKSKDITHTLDALEGDAYGKVSKYLKRPVS